MSRSEASTLVGFTNETRIRLLFGQGRRVYNPRVHPEVQELQPKLKEVLYDCAVELRPTKAALYLFDAAARFELITEYGFRGSVPQTADRHDPVVDRWHRAQSGALL